MSRRLRGLSQRVAAFALSLALLVAAAMSTGPSRARAQDAYRCIDELSDAQVSERLGFIERSFARTERRGRAWYWGFWTLMLGIAVGETVIAVRDDTEAGRVDAALGAAGATFVLTALTTQPFLGAFGTRRLGRHAARTPEERRAKLRYATDLLERSSDQEQFLTSWFAHASAWAYGAVVGSLMLVRYDDPWRATLGYISGLFITEPRLLSQPQQQVRDWERYRGDTCSAPYVRPPEPPIELSLRSAPGGLGLALSF